MYINTVIGILIPFLGTSLGAAMVFVLKDNMGEKLQKALTGFAAGVMVAASFWSLLVPALEQSESFGKFAFIPAAVGFLIGVGFLLLLDEITPHMHTLTLQKRVLKEAVSAVLLSWSLPLHSTIYLRVWQ